MFNVQVLKPPPCQASRTYLHGLLAITIRGNSKKLNISALQNTVFILYSITLVSLKQLHIFLIFFSIDHFWPLQ
jgi:hypothetical protein